MKVTLTSLLLVLGLTLSGCSQGDSEPDSGDRVMKNTKHNNTNKDVEF